MPADKSKLPPMQERFVAEYPVDHNATEAAIRAGYSKKTAAAAASRLLKNVKIAAALQRASRSTLARLDIKKDRLVQELACIALSDIGDVMDFSNGVYRLKRPCEVPEHARRAISSIKCKRRTEGKGEDAYEVEDIEFKLWPKEPALKDILQMAGDIPPGDTTVNLNVGTVVGIGQLIAAIRERLGRDGDGSLGRAPPPIGSNSEDEPPDLGASAGSTNGRLPHDG